MPTQSGSALLWRTRQLARAQLPRSTCSPSARCQAGTRPGSFYTGPRRWGRRLPRRAAARRRPSLRWHAGCAWKCQAPEHGPQVDPAVRAAVAQRGRRLRARLQHAPAGSAAWRRPSAWGQRGGRPGTAGGDHTLCGCSHCLRYSGCGTHTEGHCSTYLRGSTSSSAAVRASLVGSVPSAPSTSNKRYTYDSCGTRRARCRARRASARSRYAPVRDAGGPPSQSARRAAAAALVEPGGAVRCTVSPQRYWPIPPLAPVGHSPLAHLHRGQLHWPRGPPPPPPPTHTHRGCPNTGTGR